jgi:hypothetical protein
MPYPEYPCPRCQRPLEAGGELTVDGAVFPVYQCDDCIIQSTMFGSPTEVCYTFYLDPDGNPVDAADLDAS